MAISAVANRGGGRENPFVVILMAGRAGIVRQGGRQALRVALPAIHRRMFSPKPKLRQAVIKVTGVDAPEGLLIVAICTTVPKLIVVDVRVAAITVIGVKAGPILENPGRRFAHVVATGTIDPLVRPSKGKTGLAVIEPPRLAQREERRFRMALLTIRAQVALVNIRMAIVTIREFHAGKNLEFLPPADFLLMAVNALYFFMPAQKSKARLIVVKFAGRREGLCGMAARTIV